MPVGDRSEVPFLRRHERLPEAGLYTAVTPTLAGSVRAGTWWASGAR